LKMGPLPRQVQIFLPTPLTPASAMYFTGLSYPEGEPIRIPRNPSDKKRQKDAVLGGLSEGDHHPQKKMNPAVQDRKGLKGEPECGQGEECSDEGFSSKKKKDGP
jgi:hypothetical protein